MQAWETWWKDVRARTEGINVEEVLWSHREKYMGLSAATEKKWSVAVFALQPQQAALTFIAI